MRRLGIINETFGLDFEAPLKTKTAEYEMFFEQQSFFLYLQSPQKRNPKNFSITKSDIVMYDSSLNNLNIKQIHW